MQNAVAIIHYNTWYIHVSRADDETLICLKHDDQCDHCEVEYFTSAFDASDWVLQPVRTYPSDECILFTSGVK